MSKINKIDFYCGAFFSYLITNKIEPTLFDANDISKEIGFLLRDKEFKVYLKYVNAEKQIRLNGKEHDRWDIIFTKKENEYLHNSFFIQGKENIIVLVCANSKLRNTFFALLSYNDAIKCLGNDMVNQQYRISIRRQKGSPYAFCWGTALSDVNAIKIINNIDEFFDFK